MANTAPQLSRFVFAFCIVIYDFKKSGLNEGCMEQNEKGEITAPEQTWPQTGDDSFSGLQPSTVHKQNYLASGLMHVLFKRAMSELFLYTCRKWKLCHCHVFLYIHTLSLFLSMWDTQTECAAILIVSGGSIALCFISPFDKAWGRRSASSTAILFSPSPHAHSCRWVVFSSPSCHLPTTVPSATCDSSSTWPSQHPPILCRPLFPRLSENTSQQAWHTCHAPSRSQASNPKCLSWRHTHLHNHIYIYIYIWHTQTDICAIKPI